MTAHKGQLSVQQRLILQLVHEAFAREGRWPTYQHVDKALDALGYDLEQFLPTIPFGLIVPNASTLRTRPKPQPNDPVRLTIAGLAAYGSPDVALFLRVLRTLIERERRFRPQSSTTAEELVIPSGELRQELAGPGGYPSDRDLLRIKALLEFEPSIYSGMGETEYGSWHVTISRDIRRYRDVFTLDQYLEQRETILASARVQPSPPAAGSGIRQAIFLVHGRNEGWREEVRRFLAEAAGFEIMVLHDQPNLGRTVLEKFEDYAGVATFAVVLLTGDDLGGPSEARDFRSRARQNVVLELGFFFGKLGRRRVVVLYEESVELPSDIAGLVYIPLDASGSWRAALAKELEAAGIELQVHASARSADGD